MLSLISQLNAVDKRPETAKKIAAELGVKDLLVFICDEELGILLPAPGFQQTLPMSGEWREFLRTCNQSGVYTQNISDPITSKKITATALVYENKLAVTFIGDMPSEQNLSLLRQSLPLLASLFYYEQYVDQAKVYVQQAEASAVEHRNIASKLDSARKSLQAALREKDEEIFERAKSETALAESEQRFRFMAESLSTMIFTSHPSGKLDYVSPRWGQYTGLSLDTIRKDGLEAVLHPDDLNTVLPYWNQAYKSGTPIEQEVRLKRPDGTYRWHLSRAEAMRNDKGEIIMWVGSSTDIEDVKANMKKKNELEEQAALLTKQQKDLIELNAAKDEFIRLASHQLRTPATGVKMYIGMLREGYADQPTPNQIKMLDQAYASNDRQLHIIDDLLKVATIDAGKVVLNKKICNLEELVSDVIQEITPTVTGRQQRITFLNPSKPICAVTDKRFIRMVIENLIDNASKYSPGDTTITVSININNNGSKEIKVRDQGVGIAKKDYDLLFQKFSRIQNTMSISADGTGLGLYWAKEIITLHGGSITLDSTLGHGSTFLITLP